MSHENKIENHSIGIVIFSLGAGGAERFVTYFATDLIRQGVDVHLFLMEDIVKYPVPNGVNLHLLSTSRGKERGIIKLLKLPVLARRYARKVRELGIDYSFSLLTRPNLINIFSRRWFKNRAKIIISERSYPSMSYGQGDLQSKINRFLISRYYKDADLVIGNSYGNAKDLVDNFNVDRQRAITIPNPIDLERIEGIEAIPDFFDKSYLNLITIGRLVRGKNHQLLINAISFFPNLRLYIIGDGELRKDLEALISKLHLKDRVILLGHQPNPFEYLKSADIFAFASNHEGFPNVLLEAMSCGLPILTTNCKSGPDEILKYAGENTDSLMITKYGLLVPVGDLEQMKAGMAYFMNQDKYRSECEIAVKERVKDFDKDQILSSYTKHIFE